MKNNYLNKDLIQFPVIKTQIEISLNAKKKREFLFLP